MHELFLKETCILKPTGDDLCSCQGQFVECGPEQLLDYYITEYTVAL